MDALLQYLLFRITWKILLIEVCLMIACCLAIVVIKWITKWGALRTERIQGQLSTLIEEYLFNQQPLKNFEIPQDLCQMRNLVEVLEKFDQRFTDQRWKDIKEKIISRYLLPLAEKNVNSRSWIKRQLAARSFLLWPAHASEAVLGKLLKDSKYLVRVVAAVCTTHTSYRKLFTELIHQMAKETELSRFPYRDALIQLDQEKFSWLEEILKTETDPKIIAICLDVLSTRYSKNLLSLIRPHVNSPDLDCRALAIKALGNIPSEEVLAILKSHLFDSDWKIRTEAINALQKLYAIDVIPELRRLLNDPVWWVRLQAALALKSFGKDGRDVLVAQDKDKEPNAYEISQYILALPS